MSTETLDNLEQIRAEVSHESFKKRSFKRRIEELLIDVTDEDLDKINDIREKISESSMHIENVCSKIQKLSWTLIDPNEEQLEIVNDIIILARSVIDPFNAVVNGLHPLWSNGIISSEIETFKDVVAHWGEVIDDFEAAFFTLPADSNFMRSKSELELL